MKSITVHGLDSQLENLIRSRAEAAGLSMNKTIKRLLEEAVGMTPREATPHRPDFEEFLGAWSAEDQGAFEDSTPDLRRIDPEDWR